MRQLFQSPFEAPARPSPTKKEGVLGSQGDKLKTDLLKKQGVIRGTSASSEPLTLVLDADTQAEKERREDIEKLHVISERMIEVIPGSIERINGYASLISIYREQRRSLDRYYEAIFETYDSLTLTLAPRRSIEGLILSFFDEHAPRWVFERVQIIAAAEKMKFALDLQGRLAWWRASHGETVDVDGLENLYVEACRVFNVGSPAPASFFIDVVHICGRQRQDGDDWLSKLRGMDYAPSLADDEIALASKALREFGEGEHALRALRSIRDRGTWLEVLMATLQDPSIDKRELKNIVDAEVKRISKKDTDEHIRLANYADIAMVAAALGISLPVDIADWRQKLDEPIPADHPQNTHMRVCVSLAAIEAAAGKDSVYFMERAALQYPYAEPDGEYWSYFYLPITEALHFGLDVRTLVAQLQRVLAVRPIEKHAQHQGSLLVAKALCLYEPHEAIGILETLLEDFGKTCSQDEPAGLAIAAAEAVKRMSRTSPAIS